MTVARATVSNACPMTCGNCGRQNPTGALYCLDCGQKLQSLAQGSGPLPVAAPFAPPPAAPPPAAPPPAEASVIVAPAAPSPARCARCGTDNTPGLRFCRMCGMTLQSDVPTQRPAPVAVAGATPCPRCGTLVDRSAAFCGVCGMSAGEIGTAAGVGPAVTPGLQTVPPVGAHAAAPVAPVVGFAVASPGVAPMPAPASPLRAPSSPSVHEPPAGRVEARTDNFGAISLQPSPQLVTILKDGSEGPAHRLTNAVTDIGRYEGNITLPDDPYLSPRHARVQRRGERYYLRDLGSVNGVFYRVREAVELHHGDVVLVGQQVLRIEVLSDAEVSLGPVMHYGVMLFGTPEQPRLVRLVQLTSEGVPRDVYHLYRDETVIGRESGDIVFTDDVFLSRRHVTFRLDRQQRRVVVRDLGSSNGTLVLFRGEREITDGDIFRIGHHLFRFDTAPRVGANSGTPSR